MNPWFPLIAMGGTLVGFTAMAFIVWYCIGSPWRKPWSPWKGTESQNAIADMVVDLIRKDPMGWNCYTAHRYHHKGGLEVWCDPRDGTDVRINKLPGYGEYEWPKGWHPCKAKVWREIRKLRTYANNLHRLAAAERAKDYARSYAKSNS